MTFPGWLTIVLFAVDPDRARAAARQLHGEGLHGRARVPRRRIFGGPERLLYRLMRVDPERGQDWKAYAKSLIIFSLAGWLLLYLILRTQTLLELHRR